MNQPYYFTADGFIELLSGRKGISRACQDARDWAHGKTFKEVWETCERGDWMLWLFHKMQDKEGWGDLRNKTAAAAYAAAAYAAAAYAAAAAADDAAADDARKEILKKCADICRQTLITPLNIHNQ